MTRERLAAATATALSVFALSALSTATASASATPSTYHGQYSIAFTTEAACATASAARNDPPEVYAYPCESFTIGGVTEWHYWYKYSVD